MSLQTAAKVGICRRKRAVQREANWIQVRVTLRLVCSPKALLPFATTTIDKHPDGPNHYHRLIAFLTTGLVNTEKVPMFTVDCVGHKNILHLTPTHANSARLWKIIRLVNTCLSGADGCGGSGGDYVHHQLGFPFVQLVPGRRRYGFSFLWISSPSPPPAHVYILPVQ